MNVFLVIFGEIFRNMIAKKYGKIFALVGKNIIGIFTEIFYMNYFDYSKIILLSRKLVLNILN
jgi:hypothetical protein